MQDDQNLGQNNEAADEGPDCLSPDDAAAAVLDCLGRVLGRDASNIDMGTSISDILPDPSGDLIGLRRLLACIKDRTDFDLDAGGLSGGTLQDIADKLEC